MLFNKKLDRNNKTKKGFTLVELLAVIVVITLISGVGIITYLKTINTSKNKATLLAINNVKEAAYLYSKEGTDEIEWINSYDESGNESGKYACVSVQQLINKGYFKNNFFDKEIYKDSGISKNTFIEVSMGTNNDNLKVVVNKNNVDEEKCIGSAINTNLFHLKLKQIELYTDTIKFELSPQDESINANNYTVSIVVPNTTLNSNNGKVEFKGLKNNTNYKIKACMKTGDNKNYCDTFNLSTKDFINPEFTIDSGWKKEKTIKINYDDTPIYDKKGSHYFTSEVNGTVTEGEVYSCDANYSNCNSTTNKIVSGEYYKSDDKNVSFKTTDNIDKGVSKKLTAIIKDPTDNSGKSLGTVNRIDRVPPTCQILNAPSGWVGKNFELKSSCSDSGSGCSQNSYVTKVSSSSKKTITVSDKVGNTSTCSAYVMVDTTPPTCNVSVDGGVKGNQINNTNEYWYKEGTSSSNPVKVTIGCNDENGCEQDSVSGGSFYTDGEHKYSKEIKDKFGNTTTCSGTIKIDATRPNAKIGHDSNNYTLTDESTDSGGSKIVSSSWSGAEVGTGGTRYLKVTDGAGNSDTASIQVYKYCSKTKVNQSEPSKVDDVKVEAYYWGNRQECNGVNRNYNNFHEYGCQCKQDVVTEKSCGTSAQWKYDTHNKNQATIHYDSASDCKNKQTNNINYLCSSEDKFTDAYNAIKSGPKLYYFHGLYWFNGNNTTNSNVINVPGPDYPWTISSDRKSAKYSKDYTKEEICELACEKKYGTN